MQTAILMVGLASMASVATHAQTSVSVSLFGAFTGITNNNTTAYGVTQSSSDAAGGLLEVRHIAKPWFGYEGTYSINRANQSYSSSTYAVCGVCNITTSWTPVSANMHEVTGAWVASLKFRNLRPFALAGGGILFDVPSSGQATTSTLITGCGTGNPGCVVGTVTTSSTPTNSATKPVFVYGAGVDWKLLPHVGLRLQYRGNLYKAPNLTALYTSTGALLHTAEPMIGAYFRF
jgi:opacity protein-like surface antigen